MISVNTGILAVLLCLVVLAMLKKKPRRCPHCHREEGTQS